MDMEMQVRPLSEAPEFAVADWNATSMQLGLILVRIQAVNEIGTNGNGDTTIIG
jgi:hypothetical protein